MYSQVFDPMPAIETLNGSVALNCRPGLNRRGTMKTDLTSVPSSFHQNIY